MSSDDKRVRKRPQQQQQQDKSPSKQTSSNGNGHTTNGSSSSSSGGGVSRVEPRRARSQQHVTTTSSSSSSASSKEEMSKYVLWRRPVHTLYYFVRELIDITIHYVFKLLTYRKLVGTLLLTAVLVAVGFQLEGAHLPIFYRMRKLFFWYAYWVGLGVASSIGLGTGLHTFLLYLGPFIAQVTLAAYECDSLEFPEPPYPDQVLCPPNATSDGSAETTTVSFFSIMAKVRMESIMWGAGTAIGELPPYFMARASAMSGRDHKLNADDDDDKDEDLEEFEHLLELEKSGKVKLNLLDRMRIFVFKIIRKVGFMGILLCASIPNPLFDLAGITCGHFMVPFSTFFGATLIGKAIIKMHIQQLFVIFLFSQHHLDNLFSALARVPYVGATAQPVFQEWLKGEKAKLHKSGGSRANVPQGESILSWLLGKFVLLMIVFFVVSIVNSLAQRRAKRLSHHHHHSSSSLPPSLSGNKIAND